MQRAQVHSLANPGLASLDFNSMDSTVQKKGGWLPEALSEDPEQPFPEIS